jgi:hypothetical protein
MTSFHVNGLVALRTFCSIYSMLSIRGSVVAEGGHL